MAEAAWMAGSLCSQWVVSMAGEDGAAGGGGGETRQVVEGGGHLPSPSLSEPRAVAEYLEPAADSGPDCG